MTLEQLLGLSADELEKITDAEAEAIYAPFFNVTRPEYKAKGTQTKTITKLSTREDDNAVSELLKALGMSEIKLKTK